jgi:hypothetical protein
MEQKSQSPRQKGRKPAGDAVNPRHYFDDAYYTRRWTEYFSLPLGDPEKEIIRSEIVVASQLIAKARIRMLKLSSLAPEAELMQEAAFKVLKDFEKFDPNKKKKKDASAFIYLTTIITHWLLTYVFKVRKHRTIFISFPQSSSSSNGADAASDRPAQDPVERMPNDSMKVDPKAWLNLLEDEDTSIKMNLLTGSAIGQEIVNFISGDHSLSSEMPEKSVYTLRSLMCHLKSKDFSTQECKQYLRALKIDYRATNGIPEEADV